MKKNKEYIFGFLFFVSMTALILAGGALDSERIDYKISAVIGIMAVASAVISGFGAGFFTRDGESHDR